jgi:hypothetical protein
VGVHGIKEIVVADVSTAEAAIARPLEIVTGGGLGLIFSSRGLRSSSSPREQPTIEMTD